MIIDGDMFYSSFIDDDKSVVCRDAANLGFLRIKEHGTVGCL